MRITATTDHGGLVKQATFTADTVDEFARKLEYGVCGPVFKRDPHEDYLHPVWRELRVMGVSKFAWTTFERSP